MVRSTTLAIDFFMLKYPFESQNEKRASVKRLWTMTGVRNKKFIVITLYSYQSDSIIWCIHFLCVYHRQRHQGGFILVSEVVYSRTQPLRIRHCLHW